MPVATPSSSRRPYAGLSAIGASLTLLLVGCGNGDEADPDDPDSFDGADVTIWHSTGFDPFLSMNEEYFEECVDELDAEVNITVDVFADNLPQQMLQAASADSLPDLVLLSSSEIAQFGSEGVLEDLAEFGLDDTEGMDDVVASLGQYEGVQYGNPSHAETYSLFVNPELLAEVGYDGVPETFDDVVEAASALEDAGYEGITLPGDPNQSNTGLYFLSFYVGAGGDPAELEESIETDTAVEVLTLYKDLYDQGMLPSDFVNWGWDAPGDFRAENAGMTVSGGWEFYEDYAFDYDFDVTTTPVQDGNSPGGAVLGYSWALPVTGDDAAQAASAALLECRNTEENQLETAEEAGYIPALLSAQDSYIETHPDVEPFVEAIPASFNTGAMDETWFDVAMQLSNAIQYATADGDDPETALQRAAED